MNSSISAPTVAAPKQQPPGEWARMRLWASAHAVDDFYQGLVPAAIPYFVLERDFSYVAASGLALAATLGSAIPQLLVGLLADRRQLPWLAPAGVALAGTGAGLAGVVGAYPAVFTLLLLSGLGAAMFHPPAGRDARRAAGSSATAMSYFAVGGSVGFFVAPAVATPAIDAWGLGATVLFIPPAVLMGFILLRNHQRTRTTGVAAVAIPGRDRPRLFVTLTAIEITRSSISFGINTFVALYWIRHFHASSGMGGVALTLDLAGGVAGTLLGGRLADRVGAVRTVQAGNVLLILTLAGLLACQDMHTALIAITAVGIATNIPFAVLIRLGQDYLPSRPGTAAGVTLGLAMSAGGLAQPLFGLVAESRGTRAVFIVLALLPIVAVAMSLALREPRPVLGDQK